MKHDSTVSKCPVLPTGCLFSQKAILDPQEIMRKRCFVKDMPVSFIEVLILVIGYMNNPILDRESIIVVNPSIVSADLDSPPF